MRLGSMKEFVNKIKEWILKKLDIPIPDYIPILNEFGTLYFMEKNDKFEPNDL